MADIRIEVNSLTAPPAETTGARFIRFQALQATPAPQPSKTQRAAPLAGLIGNIPVVPRKRYSEISIDVQGTQAFDPVNKFGKKQIVFSDAPTADTIIALAKIYAPLLNSALNLAEEPVLRLPLLSEDSPIVRCTVSPSVLLPANFAKGSQFKATITLSTVMVGCKSPNNADTILPPTLLAQVRTLHVTSPSRSAAVPSTSN